MIRLKAQSQLFGCWTLSCVALLSVFALAPRASAVEVFGWTMPELSGSRPELKLGDDPVSGRQLCPALTRLNLKSKKSEVLLLKRIAEEFRDEKRGALWRLELGSNLYWWSGSVVKASDVAEFVENSLPELVQSRGAGLWELPDHEIKVENGKDVVVKWRSAPAFGPYLFNDAPFFRTASSGSYQYECAGLYLPVAEAFGVTLKPAPGYRMHKTLPEVRIYHADARPAKLGTATFELRYPNGIEGTLAVRNAKSGRTCGQSVELPYAMMILWNTRQGPTADRSFRQLMTQLTPRGALVNEAAVSLAHVGALPVPRQHPGYNKGIRTRPFDIKGVSERLNQLGFRRRTASSPRLNPAGQPLTLTLRTQSTSSGLVEKVITDAYSAVGIDIKFTRDANRDVDGILASFDLDWPRVSFIGNFHSRVADTSPFWSPSDAKLDGLLESYARTLTMPEPDFALLEQIQARMADLEPVTMLMQHMACVQVGKGLKVAQSINQNDPDWFRQLLF